MTDDRDDVGGAGTDGHSPSDALSVGTVTWDWRGSSEPSVAVIEAVAAASDTSIADLPPLYETVDPEAIDGLIADAPADVRISFRYADTTVSLCGDGLLEVNVETAP